MIKRGVIMAKRRDDFTETTKRIMASRVGYYCSCPDCDIFTIGPSYEGNDKVSNIGVAAHICAAATGGKRYDKTMTKEERRSLDNGIWLCQTHARLIDTDEKTYNISLLKEWKRQAEEKASKRIADGNFLSNYFNVNGDNITPLIDLMDNCVKDGEYVTLSFIISNYKANLGDIYNEVILRYQIIYCAYCNRYELQDCLNKYLDLPKKDGINELAELLISLDMVSYLEQIIPLINNQELKELAELIKSNSLIKKFLLHKEDKKRLSFQYHGNTDFINKYISYYVYKENHFNIVDQDGNLYMLYEDEFFYKCLFMAFEMSRCVLKLTSNSKETYVDFFKQNIEKMLKLDLDLQEMLFDTILKNVMQTSNEYEWFYNRLSNDLKSRNCICENNYFYQISNGLITDADELLQFCSSNDVYEVLLCYVDSLPLENKIEFLNQHQYLYDKNVNFITIRYKASKEDIKEIINKYKEKYSDSFGFVCIDVIEGNVDRIDWLMGNLEKLTIPDCSLYITALEKNHLYKELIDLAELIKPRELLNNDLYRIGCILTQNKDTQEKALEIYTHLESKDYYPKGLLLNKGIIKCRLGKIEASKKCFAKEYDIHKYPEALIDLLLIRYQNNQFYKDKYLEEAKTYKDNATLLGLIGAILAKLNDKNAYKYFLKSLLIDENNDSAINNLLPLVNPMAMVTNPDNVGENTVCYLSADNLEIIVAIHEPSVLEGITPNRFAGCIHISSEDSRISQCLYRCVGEKAEFLGTQYIITNIESLPNFLGKIAIQNLIKHPETIIFSGSIEKSLKDITEFAKNSAAEIDKIINDYNSSALRLPLTSFSKMIGKGRLECLDFLHHKNEVRIINNNSALLTYFYNFVLSYEAIVTICKLNIIEKIPKDIQLFCTQQVKSQMILDIDNEFRMLSSPNHAGSLGYQDGKLTMIEFDDDFKRLRHKYLSNLKRFLNSLTVLDNYDYTASTETLNNLFVDEKWLCEGTSLAAVKGNDNYCLVADDQLVFNVAQLDGSNCIGILALVSVLDLDLDGIISVLLQLASLNYTYYFSPDIYNKCVELIEVSDNKKEASSKFYDFMATNKHGEKPSEFHSQLMLYVFREIVKLDPNFIINNHSIIDLVKIHYSLLYPDDFKRIVMNAYKDILSFEEANPAETEN